MPLTLQGTYLGLGSVVRLDNEDVSGLFVVLARGAYRPDSEKSVVVPRYLVGPHPYGEAPDQETFPILAVEVRDVVFEGYTDDADAAFLEDLFEQMEYGRRPKTPAEQFTESLTVIPEIEAEGEDPPYGADPFARLRKLIAGNHEKDER